MSSMHTQPSRVHTHIAPFSCPRKRPQESLFLCFCTHESTAHGHTCAPHLATPAHIQSPLPPPWLWTPRIWARTIPLLRPRSAAARCTDRPPPGRLGGGGYYAVPGSSKRKRLSSQPLRSWPQTLNRAFRLSISLGGGRTRQPAGGALRRGRRGRRESAAATPPSPWRRRGGAWRTQPGDQSWVIREAGAPSTAALWGGAICE